MFASPSGVANLVPVSIELIATLANLSFSEGSFPTSLKQAHVTPLLKKPGLSTDDPSNYRPISNLNYISKVLERLFLPRFQSHVTNCPNFNSFQSAYRRHHSTETALLCTLDNIYHNSARGCATALISLDLSAAFDTIDHSILINRLHSSFGVSGLALSWISSYLTNRTQIVRIGNSSSDVIPLSTGVPQGSVLGPLLFSIYTSPVAHIASAHNVPQQQYADDTQLYVAISAASASSAINNLESCLLSLHSWYLHNGLAVNPDKSEAIIFGTSHAVTHAVPSSHSINVAGSSISFSNHIKLLGVTLDSP